VPDESAGAPNGNSEINNYITVSGTYNGFFDEIYHIVINKEVSIQTPSKDGTNDYQGTITTGGVYDNSSSAITYYINISALNGTTMGAGTGSVPTMSWTSTGNADDGGPVELLYANYWYKVGTRGLMVKFTDAVFNTCTPGWTIVCNKVEYAQGLNSSAAVGVAKFVWGSSRGDDSTQAYDTSTGWTALGTRGVQVSFQSPLSADLSAGDEFFVICTPPQPSYNITNLNYGNVTVSTDSPIRNVMFEIMSGAVEISTVKFGLQNHGSFSHHGEGGGDTEFRFGTVGPGNNAGTAGGYEWYPNVTASDISDGSDLPPSWLHAINHALDVVSDADSSESVGVSTFAGMVADPIWSVNPR
jgi:hypothetical protein